MEPVALKLITLLFVTLMLNSFVLIAPDTLRVPVRLSSDVDPDINTRSPDPANLLFPSLYCIEPLGGAEPLNRFPFTNAQPKSAI